MSVLEYPRELLEDDPEDETHVNGREDLNAFEEFCSLFLRTENGKTLVLYEGERVLLTDFFRGVIETLIIIPKKNGKSTLLAALALFHLFVTPDAECIIVASSRDQAAILLRQAQGFIRRSPILSQRFVVNKREISYKRMGGRIRILASDVDTADGAIPTLVLVDELHRHKSADLYGILRDGLGPLNGQLIAISTAGETAASFLGEMRTRMHAVVGFKRVGPYCYVRTPVMSYHEFSLQPEDDRTDMKIVKLANPAPWQTEERLSFRFESPSMRAWQWARFACGIWLQGENGAVSEQEWRACAVPGLSIPPGVQGVYVGIDLGWRWDTTALVPIWVAEGSEMVMVNTPTIIEPPRDGTSTDFNVVWNAVVEIGKLWPSITFVIDPNADGEQLAQKIANELPNHRVAEHSQQPKPMALAAQRMCTKIRGKMLQHPENEDYTAQVMAAIARPVGEGFRFDKTSDNGLPIDACVATGMAISAYMGEEPEEEYETGAW